VRTGNTEDIRPGRTVPFHWQRLWFALSVDFLRQEVWRPMFRCRRVKLSLGVTLPKHQAKESDREQELSTQEGRY
jgi:hypothetical protein